MESQILSPKDDMDAYIMILEGMVVEYKYSIYT